MAEVATVRAEIKAWERSFKELNGRIPAVDDIKQNPSIAEKYKQYKKLSKAAVSAETTQKVKSAAPPSTPPRTTRPKDTTTILLSKARPVQPPAPLSSFNPFSPQKRQKGKERERPNVKQIDESRSNPFVKPDLAKRDRRTSPDPFPSFQPSQPSSSTTPSTFSLNSIPLPTSAVSRARKRLRGELVSPSPNKDKRRRISSQTILPFPRLKLDEPISEDEDDFMEGDSSFVDNSPVKPPVSGKSYQPLFEESLIPVDLFGIKGGGDTARIKVQKVSTSKGRLKPSALRTKQESNNSATDSLAPSNLRNPMNLTNDKIATDSNAEVSSNRSSAKRALDEDDVDEEVAVPRARSPLIPPSPPPGGNKSFNQPPGKNKGKAKATTNRKKVKVNDDAPMDDDSDLEPHESKAKLRIVGRHAMQRQHAAAGRDEDAVTSDSDPILGYTRFTVPHASSQNDVQLQDGDVEVNLPDELRRVLAIQSAGSKDRMSEEERLVNGLLYGRRTNHYDPVKGGEIWDVGEDHHVDADGANTEGEDDWEGEPVPWEVGEL